MVAHPGRVRNEDAAPPDYRGRDLSTIDRLCSCQLDAPSGEIDGDGLDACDLPDLVGASEVAWLGSDPPAACELEIGLATGLPDLIKVWPAAAGTVLA